jgi:hypothetical protein
MKKQQLRKGWTEKRIRVLAAHHDQQTEEELANEIESAMSARGQTMVVITTRLVQEIQALIARKRCA